MISVEAAYVWKGLRVKSIEASCTKMLQVVRGTTLDHGVGGVSYWPLMICNSIMELKGRWQCRKSKMIGVKKRKTVLQCMHLRTG